MSPLNKAKSVIGDCEVKNGHTNVEVWLEQGNIWMCAECREEEYSRTAANIAHAQTLIEQSRETDSNIHVVQDIFNAKTVGAMELLASIEQDDSIPQEKKLHVFTEECAKRHDHLKKVIFEQMNSLQQNQNELKMWSVTIQTAAGKMQSAEREKYRQYAVNYQPEPVKKIKKIKAPSNTPVKNARMDARQAHEAAAKYPGLSGASVHALASAKHISFEAAAEQMARMSGLLD